MTVLPSQRTAARPTASPLILAVTVLTSLDEAELLETGVSRAIGGQIEALARLAVAEGIEGVVASPLEARRIREECGPEIVIVTPGIRPGGFGTDDQRRTAT